MVYPNRFHRLVILGTAFTDVWNTSLSIAADNGTDLEAVTPELLETIAGVVSAWYTKNTAPNVQFGTTHKLTGIKLNRIGVDGRYVDDTTQEWTYPTPLAGTNVLTPIAQAATVMSLRTAAARGPASRGRMYLPPATGFTAPDATTGLASAAAALRVAQAGAEFIDGINDAYNATFPTFSVGEVVVASNTGLGRFRRVTEIQVGRVPDVMRSRRSALSEDYQSAAVPA